MIKQVLRLLLSMFLLAGAAPHIYGQVTVRGTVSTEDGETLPGVNVIVENTTQGTVTDIDGKYTIELTNLDVNLVFSYIGFQTETVPVSGRSVVDLVMSYDISQLNEVVVIGYGTVQKSDLTGSVSSIKGEELIKIPSSNPVQALQGKIPGLQVTSSSGAPGTNPVVRVRGTGTLNDASPIYVVDGVITNDISFLNSADIQSIEVLKDASATAIYGSRGANGVIMVTTNRAEIGQETVFSYSGEYSLQEVANEIDLLNGREFATIYNEISPGSFNNLDVLPNTDWQDLIFQTGAIQNHQISASGASEEAQYYVGLGYFNQEGIIDKSSYERVTVKLNNSFNLTEFLTIGNNITIAPYKQETVPNVTYAAYRAHPIEGPYLSDGRFSGVNYVGNPLASLEYSNSFNRGFRGVGNFFAEIKFLKDFTFRTSYGIDYLLNKSESFTPQFTVFFPDGTPSNQETLFSRLSKGTTDNLSWLWENTISYNKEFGRSRVDAVVGYTTQESTSEIFDIVGQNLLRDSEDFWYIRPEYILDESNNINNIGSISNRPDNNRFFSMMSYLARVNYSYDNRYILTATFRRDGSSKFSQENRYGNFPSFAVGWNLINEAFMPDLTWLDNLKLRASWGKIGNEKIAYLDQYAQVQSSLVVVLGEGQSAIPGATFGNTGNPNLVWETTTQTDIGLEAGFFNNRLTLELDYYRRVTDDILVQLSIPGHLGNGVNAKQTVNAASVLNRGVEFNVQWNNRVNDELSYSIGAVGSVIHNEVLTIGGSEGIDSTLVGGGLANGRTTTLTREGLPIGAFYGYQTDGIFQNQQELDGYPHLATAGVGDLRFVDVNGDGALNADDRTYIGSPLPDFLLGLNLGAQYKSIDLSIDFQGQFGNEIFNGKEVVRPDPYNFEKRALDRWTGENSTNEMPRPSFSGYNYNISDFFVQEGAFVRLRNVTLGYNLPEAVISKIKLSQVRFFLRGTNLFTWTDFTGYSPEVSNEDDLSNGVDQGSYPISRIYSAGLNIKF